MKRSPRELENAIDSLREEQSVTPEDVPDVSVEWRDADPVARPTGVEWDVDDGVLTYDEWSAQRDARGALDSRDYDITALLAGYGSGKTVFGARWLIQQALEYPGSRFLCMGVDFTKARDATFRVLFEQLPGDRTGVVTTSFNGPEASPIVANFDRQHHRLTFTNDAVIKLGSADKWSRHAGDEYGAVWLDEPSHYGEDLHDLLEMVGGRLRGVSGPKTQLWTLTGNGYNAAWSILERQEDANGDPIGLDITQVRASTLDNPYLAEADKERFTRQYADTDREEQALHGGFAASTGLVYSRFSRDVHVIPRSDAEELVDDTDGWRVYGYDAGWNDPRVLVEFGRTDYGQLVALAEYYERETHVEDAIGWLADRPDGRIHAEHVPGEIERFRASAHRVEKAEKDLDAGIAEVRNRLDADDEDRPGLLVSERCEHLIREFLGYKQEQVGASSAVDHALDATRYAVMGEATGGGGGASTSIRIGEGGTEEERDRSKRTREKRDALRGSRIGDAILETDRNRRGS